MREEQGQIRVEYGVINGVEQETYSAAIYSDLTHDQVRAIQAILDEIICLDWERRSCVPS